MTIAILSIFVLALATWAVGKISPVKFCPICAGVSLTWLWLLVGLDLGRLTAADYQLPTALLMGGTVVGLAFRLETIIYPRWRMIWKTAFIILGFTGAYNLIMSRWSYFILSLLAALATVLILKHGGAKNQPDQSENIKKLEEKMKQCC